MAEERITEGWKTGWYVVRMTPENWKKFMDDNSVVGYVVDYMIDNYGPMPEDYIMNLDNEDQGGFWDWENVFHPYPIEPGVNFHFRNASDAIRFKLTWL